MALAGRFLRETAEGIAEIASRVGYTSEFAFNRAFKREYGCPPGTYRKKALPARMTSGTAERTTVRAGVRKP